MMSNQQAFAEREPQNASTWQVVRALLWKQMHDMGALLGVMLAANVALTIVVFACMPEKSLENLLTLQLSITLTLGTGIAFATGIVAYVNEREYGTDSLLARFPVSGQLVGTIKLVSSLLTLVVFGLLQLGIIAIVAMFRGNEFGDFVSPPKAQSPEAEMQLKHAFFLGTACLMGSTFAASMLACTRFNRSAWATLATAAWAAVLIPLCWTMIAYSYYLQTYFGLLALALFVFAGIWWQAKRWLRPLEQTNNGRLGSSIGRTAASTVPNVNDLQTASPASPLRVLPALFGQAFYQQRIVSIVAAVVLTILFALLTQNPSGFSYLAYINPPEETYDAANRGVMQIALWLNIVGLALGIACIYPDKFKNRFQFFRQHREHGYCFWLSRVTLPLLILGIGVLISAGFSQNAASTLAVSFMCLTAFSSTLLAGLLFRSDVFTGACGLITTLSAGIALTGIGEIDHSLHAYVMALACLIPLLWLGISCWYTPIWLSGRRRNWHYVAIAVATLTLCTIVGLLIVLPTDSAELIVRSVGR